VLCSAYRTQVMTVVIADHPQQFLGQRRGGFVGGADLAHELRPDAVQVSQHRVYRVHRVTGAAAGAGVGLVPGQPDGYVLDVVAERGQGGVAGASSHRDYRPE
jgi:hypothetical protein